MTDKTLRSLKEHLITAGLSDVYIGDLPELKLNCISIRPVDGYVSTRYFGKTDIKEPLLEVLIRNTDYATGTLNYNVATETLDKLSDEAAGILSAFVTGSPGYLGRNANGFGEWHFLVHLSLTEN